MFRKADMNDLQAITDIYDHIHDYEEIARYSTGWLRDVYPTRQTAQDAILAGTMYVYEQDGRILAAGKIDRVQPPSYAQINWSVRAAEHEVMVLHTLVVHPECSSHGVATTFIGFYESTARQAGCTVLRIDTNARNTRARSLYKKLGYAERGIVPCCFNGIEGVQLVCMEKLL